MIALLKILHFRLTVTPFRWNHISFFRTQNNSSAGSLWRPRDWRIPMRVGNRQFGTTPRTRSLAGGGWVRPIRVRRAYVRRSAPPPKFWPPFCTCSVACTPVVSRVSECGKSEWFVCVLASRGTYVFLSHDMDYNARNTIVFFVRSRRHIYEIV